MLLYLQWPSLWHLFLTKHSQEPCLLCQRSILFSFAVESTCLLICACQCHVLFILTHLYYSKDIGMPECTPGLVKYGPIFLCLPQYIAYPLLECDSNFFKRIIGQLLLGAEERVFVSLDGREVSNRADMDLHFIGEIFTRICRRGYVGLVYYFLSVSV